MAELAVEDGFELGVAARNGVADDDEIERVVDVLRAIALEDGDALPRPENRSSAG